MKAEAYCDGRGNAGTGACAVVLRLQDGLVIEEAQRLEPTTNIVAEHKAIHLALETALLFGVTELTVYNDSQTPVFQVQGVYQVKMDHLRPLVEETWRLGGLFKKVSIKWVPRSETLRADELCREVDRPPARRKKPTRSI